MKTFRNYIIASIILFITIITISGSFIHTSIYAAYRDETRMLIDTGEDSGGGGGGGVAKTARTLKEILKDFFSRKSTSNNSTNTNNKRGTGTSSGTNGNAITDPDEQTYTPPPNIESAGELQFADSITKLIQDDCTNEGKGVVTKKNTLNSQMFLKKPSCITRASKPLKDGTTEINNSVTLAYYLQCVGCVRAMSDARGRSYNGTGNAKNHINQQVSGYIYVSTKSQVSKKFEQLIPGSIGIANEGTYGHIFYITDVIKSADGTPKAYKAFECNWGANGLVRHDKTRPLLNINGQLDGYMTGWQRPNSL